MLENSDLHSNSALTKLLDRKLERNQVSQGSQGDATFIVYDCEIKPLKKVWSKIKTTRTNKGTRVFVTGRSLKKLKKMVNQHMNQLDLELV
jgi:hypothetical protein